MRVLVGCEFSGVVRDAFLARGHDAYSCDLLPGEGDTARHIVGDVLAVLRRHTWDLFICFPPCTFLCLSGVRWLYLEGRKVNGPDPRRWADMRDAARFFRAVYDAPVSRVGIENPTMHGYARELVGVRRTQVIQPWQFGEGEIKATGLWLRNLPKLVPTRIVPGRRPRVHHASPGPDRWRDRSRTLPGIGAAMGDQWGGLLL